jgi:HAD superfamily, subfamily IIIB (Acid phosphatase)
MGRISHGMVENRLHDRQDAVCGVLAATPLLRVVSPANKAVPPGFQLAAAQFRDTHRAETGQEQALEPQSCVISCPTVAGFQAREVNVRGPGYRQRRGAWNSTGRGPTCLPGALLSLPEGQERVTIALLEVVCRGDALRPSATPAISNPDHPGPSGLVTAIAEGTPGDTRTKGGFLATGSFRRAVRFQREATETNLADAGYSGYEKLNTVPDGARYASATDFKTPIRAEIERAGYTILANMGDQPSQPRNPGYLRLGRSGV